MPDQSTPQSPEQTKGASDSSAGPSDTDAKNTPAELPPLPGPIEHPKLIKDTLINRIRYGIKHSLGKTLKRGVAVAAISAAGGLTGGVVAKQASKHYITNPLRPKPEMVDKLKKAVEESRPLTDKKEESGSDKPVKPEDFWSKSVSEVKSAYKKIKTKAKDSGEKMVNDSETLKEAKEVYRGMTAKIDALYKEYMDREKYLSAADRLAFWSGFLAAFLFALLAASLLLSKFGSKADPIQKANAKIQAGKIDELIDGHNQMLAFVRAAANSGDIKLIKSVADKMDSDGRMMVRTLKGASDTINKLEESADIEGDKNQK